MHYSKLVGLCCLVLSGCGSAVDGVGPTGSTQEELTGATAAGTLPAGLPARVTVGLFEDTGGTWLKNSGVKWDARYRYFTKGWVNNWGYSANDGSWGLTYLRETDQQGYVPALQYYQLVAEAGGGESATLQKVQTAATMNSYFSDFKVLMQRVKDFGKPVMVLIEADGVGFLEQQSNGNPNAYAAVAASGLPELAKLPNTVAGFGLAYLQLKQAVGASNAILGLHVSGWASGKDISTGDPTDALQPEVDKAWSFLAPLGLTNNVTGIQYDVLVGDPLDRDAGYYRVVQGQDRNWDASDAAPIASHSFNRYAEWLRLWNVKANKRWVLWQIPLGNSNSQDVWNNGGAGQGYKDNRPEYFFSAGTAHIQKFAASGVISLLFGAGAAGQSSYLNDTYSDGQLFMKSRAGAVLNAGGVPLAPGAVPTLPTVPTVPTVPTLPTLPTPRPADPAVYGFEGSVQGWTTAGSAVSVQSASTSAFAGSSSLKVNLSGSGSGSAKINAPPVPAGALVTFHVWIPTGAALSSVQPYALQGAGGGWAWTGNWLSAASLQAGRWNTIALQIPANASALSELGVEFVLSGATSASAYVDSVSF